MNGHGLVLDCVPNQYTAVTEAIEGEGGERAELITLTPKQTHMRAHISSKYL